MTLSDKDILSSGLFAVKHMTMLYNDAASQTDDPQLAKELCDMISEEQYARIKLFEAMRQRGWYNPQLIDDQQLRQSQQKLQQQMQQTTSGQFQQPTSWQTGQQYQGSNQYQQNAGQYQQSVGQYQTSPGPYQQNARQNQPATGQYPTTWQNQPNWQQSTPYNQPSGSGITNTGRTVQ